jgi:hypothetical protein
VIDEVESLLAFGEPVPPVLVASYLEALLRAARGEDARRFVRERLDPAQVPSPQLVSAAWVCYRLHALDVALELFLAALPHELGNAKLQNTLEKAARECRRVGEVIAAYERHAERQPSLYGRVKRLKRWLPLEW